MRFIDFIKSLSRKIDSFTGKEVGIDNINKLSRPAYFIQVIDYKKTFFANYRERIFISIDITYIPKNDENNKAEIYNALDDLDDMFEVRGNKILKVKDRCLTLKNEHTKIVDGLGHYIFDLDLFEVYGTDLRTFDNSIETIKEILNLASKRNIKIFYTDRRIENSQGVTALVSEFDYYMDLSDFLGKVLAKDKSIVVILDQIQDPRNFGAIIRSAECFGADGIVIQDRNNVKVTETVVKSSTGAIEHVDIVKVTNISDTIDKFKKYGYRVYGAEADGENFYYEEDYPDKVCLVLGSEGNGMRKKVKEHCDKVVKIHLKGHINSLNVSVAGGIILAEMAK